ncbi:hypothetical protein CLV30_13114 [Haloactinopolyspora alba]|uniref:DUF8094 domain-containing protein n=1 Tax=Haloactinopolyspora alba TaxID=648780 RepID=A0A2P8D706_9ACTN|nr:hypothetical protein [Haloactinopolyspora alba]PSK92988.1 hypothetical protein CLV30_13114 [Haloactinopolyspora alba]
MRTVFGVVLIVLGLPVLLAGAGAAVYTGPDDTVPVVDETIDSDASVLSTTHSVFEVTGPTLHVSAGADDAETFVGVAHPVHVDSYLDSVAQESVTEVGLRGEITRTSVDGEASAPGAAPEGLGWWQQSASGSGEQSISFELTERPLRLVVTQPTPGGPLAVDVAVGAEIGGLFVTAVLVGVLGLVLIAGGVVLLVSARRRRRRRDTTDTTDDTTDETAGDTGQDTTAAETGDEAAEPATTRATATGGSLTVVPPGQDGDEAPAPAPEPSGDATPDDERPGAEADGDVIPLHGPRPGPPAPPPPEPPKPTARVSVLAGLLGTGVLVTGCAQVPEQIDNGDRVMSVQAITGDGADEFFAHYTEANNTANAERDRELLATIETGTLLETSRFSYEEQETQGEEPWEPFTVTPSSVAAPRLTEYPLWSFVTTESDDGDGTSWYYLTRADAATPWRARLAVHPESDVDVPAPSIADGAAVVADDEAAEQGMAVLDELAAFAETGTEPEGVDLANAGGVSRLPEHGLQLDDAPAGFGTFDRSCTVRNTDHVRWLTTEFGVMTLASIECTQTMNANTGYRVTIDGDGLGTIPGGAEIVGSSITQSVSFILSVDSDGRATVVGGRMRPTSMSYTEG